MSDESEAMDAVKPEILHVAVSHNIIRAIHAKCTEVTEITLPMVSFLSQGKEPDSNTLGHVVNGLMHLLAVVDDFAELLRNHIDFKPVMELEKSEIDTLRKVLRAHPTILKAIQYGNETPHEKLHRIVGLHEQS